MQRLKLDINPKGEIPVLYVSQCDKGRLFEVELVDGEQSYNVPSEYSVQLNVRKTDSKLVTAAPTNIADNILTFSTTEQMTACAGENIGSVTLKDADDYVITTLYFLISVQRDVLAGGLNSASEIHNLEEQIASIVPEVIGDDYYNKAQTDALLENKADVSDIPDMTDYYTKEQTDDLLYDELNHYYKKTEVDNLLNAKVDKTTLQEDYYNADYISTQFARKSFVENYVDATATASGNPCTFDTAKYHTLIQALTADIICGGGGGTPSTPIPLVGHSEINLDVNGNTFTVQFGQTVYGGVYDKSGRLTITHKVKIYNGSENWITTTTNDATKYRPTLIDDMSDGVMPTDISEVLNVKCNMFEGKTVVQTFERVEGISWQPSGSWRIYTPNYDTNDISLWKTFLSNHNLQIAYELATPIVIDVPSISVFAENGVNNIISDCGGDVNVSYKDTIQHYIDQRLQ